MKAFLKAGVMTQAGKREETRTGTPQGGILSPLLANIALSALDEHFDRQWERNPKQRAARKTNGLGNWRLIRYADDFVVMIHGERRHAEAIREEVAAVLAPLGLRLSPEKTRITHIDEGFDFLGFHIRRMRKRGTKDKHYVYTLPSKKAIQAIKDKVKTLTRGSTRHVPTQAMIARLDRVVRGWANYFRHGVSKATFSKIDHYTWGRLAHWIRCKHALTSLKQLRRRFCDRGWRLACNGATYRGASSVPVTRYRYRGYNIPTPWTPKPATL